MFSPQKVVLANNLWGKLRSSKEETNGFRTPNTYGSLGGFATASTNIYTDGMVCEGWEDQILLVTQWSRTSDVGLVTTVEVILSTLK